MIYTVTLNPALDRFIRVDSLLADDTTRMSEEIVYAAGKGIDVSRVVRELGGHSVALGLVGGYAGSQLVGLLINAGVVSDFTTIGGETRTNIILKETAPGRRCRKAWPSSRPVSSPTSTNWGAWWDVNWRTKPRSSRPATRSTGAVFRMSSFREAVAA